MLLRICLVIAILAGAGVIVVGHLKVRPHIEGIIEQRDKNAKDRDTEKAAKVKALAQLKTTSEKLKETETKLGETQTQLAAATKQIETEQRNSRSVKEKLDALQVLYTESQQKLARWADIILDPVQVRELIASEKKLRQDIKDLNDEKKILAKLAKDLRTELDSIKNPEVDPPMRAGLKGRVIVVDPKWSFVLLDVGEKDGVVKRGVFMVSRNSKLVAKVRVASLEGTNKCIANIMPGWKLGEVMEGDYVIY